MVTGVALVSLIPCILYKKTPILRRYRSRTGRILWTVALIFVPANLAMFWFGSGTDKDFVTSYQLHSEKFREMRRNGDITIMNPV